MPTPANTRRFNGGNKKALMIFVASQLMAKRSAFSNQLSAKSKQEKDKRWKLIVPVLLIADG
jgi:hypothetical protein